MSLLHTVLLLFTFSSVAHSGVEESGLTDPTRDAQVDNILLSEGFLSPDDVKYFNYTDVKTGIPGQTVNQGDIDYTYIPGSITFILISEVGESQNASARILKGGLGEPKVTVFLESDVGKGYNINTLIYGRNLSLTDTEPIVKKSSTSD